MVPRPAACSSVRPDGDSLNTLRWTKTGLSGSLDDLLQVRPGEPCPAKEVHVYSIMTVKVDPFGLQELSLQVGAVFPTRRRYPASAVDDTMPGHARIGRQTVERPADSPSRSRVPKRPRYCAVGCYLARRNLPYKQVDSIEETLSTSVPVHGAILPACERTIKSTGSFYIFNRVSGDSAAIAAFSRVCDDSSEDCSPCTESWLSRIAASASSATSG